MAVETLSVHRNWRVAVHPRQPDLYDPASSAQRVSLHSLTRCIQAGGGVLGQATRRRLPQRLHVSSYVPGSEPINAECSSAGRSKADFDPDLRRAASAKDFWKRGAPWNS